ncbi:MAG: hypothetical protein ACE15F_20885 [bacterium]
MIYIGLIVTIFGLVAPAFTDEPAPAAPDYQVPARASAPFTYCIGYIVNPEEETFLQDLSNSPPDLYHLGYQIPFKGALGPTYGHELFTDDILPPGEIPREVERIRRVIAKMRATGTRLLIPYVYTMAFFGNPEKRTGFFRFFDHWDDYAEFGLGPKPEADPSLWSQVPGPRPLGGGPADVLHYDPCVNHPAWSAYLDLVARQLASVGYDGMFFDVNTQYCYCPHCQEKFDIYLLHKYGTSGLREAFGTSDHREINLSTIYRDFEKYILENFKTYLKQPERNSSIRKFLNGEDPGQIPLEEDWRLLRCYMQGSAAEYPPENDLPSVLQELFQAGDRNAASPARQKPFTQTVLRYYFREYLQSPELAGALQDRFGSPDIRRRCLGTPPDLLLWVETQRFWCQSMADTLARLKRGGQEEFARQNRSGNFFTVANLGSMQTVDGLNKRRVDGIDLVHFAPMADLQMFEEMPQPGSLDSGVVISNIFAFRWAMGAGTRAGTLLYKVADDTAADLAQAEAAAGGGGAFIQAGLGAPDSRRRWKQFFTGHAELWNHGDSCARVGLMFWSDQVFYEYPEHFAMVRRLVNILSENQVPFDILTGEGLAAMPDYDVILVPCIRYVNEDKVNLCLSYAKQGGRLVVIEPFGTEDAYARKREAHPLSNIMKIQDRETSIAYGKGRILHLQPDDVPARRSDAWNLMEDRAGSFGLSSDYLNAVRESEVKHHIDLGPEFVARLEKALHTRLRWCPPGTNAGIYLHPYRIPYPEQKRETIVLHAVNYRVPILLTKEIQPTDDPIWQVSTKSGEPDAQHGVRISLPLPGNRKILSVKSYSPTDDHPAVEWSKKGKYLTLTLPHLHIYQAVAVEMEIR